MHRNKVLWKKLITRAARSQARAASVGCARSHDFTYCSNTLTIRITNNTTVDFLIYITIVVDGGEIFANGGTAEYTLSAVGGHTYTIYGIDRPYHAIEFNDTFNAVLGVHATTIDVSAGNDNFYSQEYSNVICGDDSTAAWLTHNYYHADGNGNITALEAQNGVLSAQYRYDPFGNLVSWSGGMAGINTYWFSSKEIMPCGLYYYGYRYYDPFLQRWINRDPLQQQTGPQTKRKLRTQAQAGWNLYALCRNNPLEFSDTNGRSFWSRLAWLKHQISEIMTPFGGGGTCCNKSSKDTFYVDNGVWHVLPAGKCTPFQVDCDGYMCGGKFYPVSNLSRGTCQSDCKGDGSSTPLPNPRAPTPPPFDWPYGPIAE